MISSQIQNTPKDTMSPIPAPDLGPTYSLAVILPCYNEAATIEKVIADFREHLPSAEIFVFDNNSSDGTAAIADSLSVQVRHVTDQGKGNVIRRMFADVEADIYVMVDGDATYDASAANHLIQAMIEHDLDMVVGRRNSDEQESYRAGHRFGNAMLTGFAASIFGSTFKDMLSGYRVFSRRYVKSFPAHSRGFETETELAVHALELRMPVSEIDTIYGVRPEGSASKLNTYRDGFRILRTILRLFRLERPVAFFGIGCALCTLAAVWLSIPIFQTYIETGTVPRLPTAVLSAVFVLLGSIFLVCGLILDSVTKARLEVRRLAYLSIPSTRSKKAKS
jgi:glycosyltransferase involved in cell wall biosynthesis